MNICEGHHQLLLQLLLICKHFPKAIISKCLVDFVIEGFSPIKVFLQRTHIFSFSMADIILYFRAE